MAFAAPLAAAGVESAAAGGAAAAGTGAAEAGAATAGRGAAGRAAGGRAGSKGAAAGAAAPTTRRSPRRPAAKATPAEEIGAQAPDAADVVEEAAPAEQSDPASETLDQVDGFTRKVGKRAAPSQQVAGGLLAAIVVYPVLLNFLKGGSPRVKQWFKAKAFNVTSTPGAASTTVQKGTGGGPLTSSGGLSSGTGSTSPPAASASSSGSAAGIAIAFARSQIGKPYGWGKAGPNAYDCSGLTSVAYAKAGISIGRTTLQQILAGKGVDRADLQPGDLVFAHPRHVAIYTGNGRIVEAPRTGLNVREVPIWGFWRARRVT